MLMVYRFCYYFMYSMDFRGTRRLHLILMWGLLLLFKVLRDLLWRVCFDFRALVFVLLGWLRGFSFGNLGFVIEC